MAIALPDWSLITELKRRDLSEAHERYFSQQANPYLLFLSYIQGVGTFDDWTLHQIRKRIDQMCIAAGVSTNSVFDPFHRIMKECLWRIAPDQIEAFFDIVPEGLIDTHILALASLNDLRHPNDPTPNTMLLGNKFRPELRIYSLGGVELYVDPYRYQLFDKFRKWFIPSASSRSLSRVAIAEATKSIKSTVIEKNVVIVQDRFPGSNFAHFTFDWITRVGHFCESGIADPEDCLFVFGGAPRRFDSLLCEALISKYELTEDSFFFPSEGVVLRTSANFYWFSDQTETYSHPAQMALKSSIKIIRSLAEGIATNDWPGSEGQFKRVYISRADAAARRVSNELQLYRTLAKFNFDLVVLSDHPIQEQIAIVRGAECVVAPHGMGLTLLSFHRGKPALVELHQLGYGTDAYAFMAMAMGFPYRFVVGEGSERDFFVPVEHVVYALQELGIEEASSIRQELTQHWVLTSAELSRWSDGVGLVEISHPSEVCQLICGIPILRHTRIDPEHRKDTNVGTWTTLEVQGGTVYTASCWIWIPRDFQGRAVLLSLGEWPRQRRVTADLSKRDTWQQVHASRTAPIGEAKCHIVLRLDGPDGAFVFSTGWKLEVGVPSIA